MDKWDEVKAHDHPDYIGGIVWSECELRWINDRTRQLRAEWEKEQGRVVVTTTRAAELVSITRQDDDGKILSVIWEQQPTESRAEIEARVKEEVADMQDSKHGGVGLLPFELRKMAEEKRASKPTVPNLEQGKVERDAARYRYGDSNGYTFGKHEYQNCADVTWLYEEDIDAAMLNDAKEGNG